MADKKITEVPLRGNVTADVNFPSDDGIQSYRVTAQQVKEYVLSLLSISTGMLQDLSVTVGKIAAGAVTDEKTNFTPPSIQRFTSGSGTYATPSGVKWIRVTMAGGGGGGGAGGTANPANAATAGGNTTFGTSLLTAAGGSGATWSGAAGGGGGNPTVNSPAIAVKSLGGGVGQGGLYVAASTTQPNGAMGGANAFGGAGYGVSSGGNNGGDARANTGGGGGGGSANGANTAQSGGGGGAGAYIEAIIHNPSSTYSYAVGAAGTAANGSLSNGGIGGAGASGMIIVEEYYQ